MPQQGDRAASTGRMARRKNISDPRLIPAGRKPRVSRLGASVRLLPVIWQPPSPPPKPEPRRRRWVAGRCQRCGKAYVAEDYTNSARYCSSLCARRDAKNRRRARKRDAFVADVYRARIFERDGWRCQLCRRPVRRDLAVPSSLAPVIDHIVPLARGGTHEPANVQCAHFMCNSIKGHRIASGIQPALFGRLDYSQ
jgi:5-methylcytosine-specific restriction endonuclease McrA